MIQCRINTLSDHFNFGKYNGLTLADVLDINPNYLEWCILNCTSGFLTIEESALIEIRKAYPEIYLSEELMQKCNTNNMLSSYGK